ncbi:uncharacterized protein LOC117917110 [Vitis riparia]|uniref:uncharacterized protein LOC117917110 n=1 Tax=Vitis riparia TaxID=96939 RepID=UPI00155B20FF|nr:uncharacterized protein LOC117917110 [Vitis riparia]
MALSHRKKAVSKRATTANSPPGDDKVERGKCNIANLGIVDGATPSRYACETRTQQPGRPKPPATTTRGVHHDPTVTPIPQNVLSHRDPLVTPMVQNVPPHQAVRTIGKNPPNEPPIGSISKRLDDMLSTPFCSHIIHYEPPRGFLVPKFSTYDGCSDPFDHIMHYRQLMTLDIGNDPLLCKVFLASLQGQALSWFHRLPPNSVDNFRDLSEAFVGQYLCSARHKQNISTLQNIKMKDNESLREFVKRFGQAVLQVEACSMDAVLQIFKRNICPDTPFFESLAKKPPMTMGDLFRRANKYSMLEDDVRAATQQVLVAGQPSKGNIEGSAKLLDRPRPSDRRQEGLSRPEMPPLTPLSITYEKLLSMIQSMFDFRWPRPLGSDLSRRDHSKKCASHKEHDHTTETCRSLQYLVERLIKAGHLRQYLRSDARDRDAARGHDSGTPAIPAAPKAVINYINGGPSDEEINSKRKRQKLLREAMTPHGYYVRTATPLILSLGIDKFNVRRILVDPGSSADLVQAAVISHMVGHNLVGLENPGRILSGFNGASTISLGDIVLPVQAGPVTLNVLFSVVQDLLPFNIILGRTWLHCMKAIPSTYHQMVSFLTEDEQINLYGSQLAARQ